MKGRLPLYLQVSKDRGCLLAWGGNLSNYGISDLDIGKPIDEQLYFMVGVFPLQESPLFFSCLKMAGGQSTDIHVFSDEEWVWILLMDATQEETRMALLQQKTNELSLLRKKMFDGWNQIKGDEATPKTDRKKLGLPELESWHEVSVLRVNLRRISLDSEKQSSEKKPLEESFKTFEKYLKMIKLPIVDAGGILISVLGGVITALFGVLPTVSSSADQAVTAALRMVETVNDINRVKEKSVEALQIGVGIATGSALLGYSDGKNRSFNVLGYPVVQVVKLESQADSFEIVIDQNTLFLISHRPTQTTTDKSPLSASLSVCVCPCGSVAKKHLLGSYPEIRKK